MKLDFIAMGYYFYFTLHDLSASDLKTQNNVCVLTIKKSLPCNVYTKYKTTDRSERSLRNRPTNGPRDFLYEYDYVGTESKFSCSEIEIRTMNYHRRIN